MASSTWQTDWSDPFVTWAHLPPKMVDHMRHSVEVSYHKYGTILTKEVSVLEKNRNKALLKWAEDGNADRLVDAANYDMFCYILTGSPSYITQATAIGKQYDENQYRSTSSDESTHITSKTVSDWLRGDFA